MPNICARPRPMSNRRSAPGARQTKLDAMIRPSFAALFVLALVSSGCAAVAVTSAAVTVVGTGVSAVTTVAGAGVSVAGAAVKAGASAVSSASDRKGADATANQAEDDLP
jgi:hypothetical protein